jgi:tRNA threonylcarbamoyladenosine biosynthesis protein TsaB
MALIAFDTCFGAVSVAVRYRAANGDWSIREEYEGRQTGHAERLMPMIAEVMAGAGLAFDQIERFAVTAGPGSFTGVRVGVAAARAFALAAGRPVVGVSSLEVIAVRGRQLLGARGDGRMLMVAIDARRGGLYCALHRDGSNTGDTTLDTGPMLLTAAAAAALARDHGALVIGSGGPILADHAAATGHTIDTELASIEPHARHLALLAVDRPPTTNLAPLYLRSPDVRPQPGPIARQS